jgi:hypothetical protein
MSPEQAMGKNLDQRTDIFSAGAVFYEFLTLQKPFKGKTLHGVLYQIVSEDPDPLLTLVPELPARLAAVVQRMLRKDPDARYGTFREVGDDLKQVHAALRRSRSRSALPQPAPPVTEELRARVREHIARGRGHLQAGRAAKGLAELGEALALDADCVEAAELAWSHADHQGGSRARPAAPDVASEARIVGLLGRAAPGRPEAEARQALAELALIAPDDPRFFDLVRARAGRRV